MMKSRHPMMISEYLLDVVQGVGLMVADVVQRVVEDLPPMLQDSPRLAVAVGVGVDVEMEGPMQIPPRQVPDVEVSDAPTAQVASLVAAARVNRLQQRPRVLRQLRLQQPPQVLRLRLQQPPQAQMPQAEPPLADYIICKYSILDTRYSTHIFVPDTRYSILAGKKKHVILDS